MTDLFGEIKRPRPYSGLMGTDRDALEVLLSVHGVGSDILDCTFNTGKMWDGIIQKYRPKTMDIDPAHRTDFVADFRSMSAVVGTSCYDVLVFDPPHLPHAIASAGSSDHPNVIRWRANYGLNDGGDEHREADHVAAMFLPFFREAAKVLRPDGVALCKISDMVHNHRYQWQHVDLIAAARESGMTPCDMLVKIDPTGGNLKSSKWENVHHLRRNHCFWIVVRNGPRCERRRGVS